MTARTVLITGCSTGIGRYCAGALTDLGWRVFASCRSQTDCDRLADEGLETIRLDYTDAASIAAAVDHVLVATGGRLDALFNNGAYSHPGAVEDLATEHVRALIETNFLGWYDLTRRVLPAMRARRSGRIVNCSSILGIVALRFTAGYTASKFAVEGWSDALRLELRGSGVHVSLIEPGPIASRMLESAAARFANTIDVKNSPFRHEYAREVSRLSSGSRSSLFKLGPEAVFAKLVRALESPRPKARYRVTIPSHVGAWLKGVLPAALLDRVLLLQR